jgi:hypothetical protein
MVKLFSFKGFLAAFFFFAWAGWGVVSAAPPSAPPPNPDPVYFPNAWAAFIILALVAIEAWFFWLVWKNRTREEKPKPEELSQIPQPLTPTRAPAQKKKRAKREREKTLV